MAVYHFLFYSKSALQPSTYAARFILSFRAKRSPLEDILFLLSFLFFLAAALSKRWKLLVTKVFLCRCVRIYILCIYIYIHKRAGGAAVCIGQIVSLAN